MDRGETILGALRKALEESGSFHSTLPEISGSRGIKVLPDTERIISPISIVIKDEGHIACLMQRARSR
jgi:hypothetical protein